MVSVWLILQAALVSASEQREDTVLAQINEWSDRAVESAKQCGGRDHDLFISALAAAYAELGDLDRMNSMMALIRDKEGSSGNEHFLAYWAMKAGHDGVAIQIVEQQTTEDRKDQCRYHAARALIEQRKFEQATVLAEEFVDIDNIFAFQCRLTESLADAGKYEEAKANLRRIRSPRTWKKLDSSADSGSESEFQGDNEIASFREAIAELQSYVNKREREGVVIAVEPSHISVSAHFRESLRAFSSDVSIDDAEETRLVADQIEDAEKRSNVWLAVAEKALKDSDKAQARMDLGQALEAARQIDEPVVLAIQLTLIADLFLEADDRETALILVREFQATESIKEALLQKLASFTTGPVIVGVFVRAGETQAIFDFLQTRKSVDEVAWHSLGQFCAEAGQLAFVERHHGAIQDPRARTSLFAGIAVGLAMLESGK